VYQRLRERGYEVFAVNPHADEVEGERCFHDLKSIPGGVEAVVIATRPEIAEATMRECAELGIKDVWMHRSFGAGSVSEPAAAWGREHGIRVIAGGCPLMFEPAADAGHKVMRWLFTLTGKVPKRVAMVVLGLAAAAAPAGAAASEAPPAPEPYTSAKACSTCHQTIHLYWSESQHSRSASKPSYLESLGAAVEGASDKEAVRRGCVWCHAPTALVTGDYGLQRPVTREGVSCDFCHTVADVDLDRRDHPFDLKPGNVKRGPLEYAKSPFHGTEYSALHKSSPLLCASCHEYTNARGAPVLSTYSEWKAGPYPGRGETCQECHMPLVPGRTVREGLQSTQRRINLHRLVGGSEASRVRGGLDVRLDTVTLGSASADVEVVVANSGVGHAAPGGLSSKSLVLAVGVETASGKLLHRQERVYRREMKDAEGRALVTVPDLFLKAASVGEDTRIKQKEARTERFTLPLPEDWKAIVARLEYRDASDPKAGTQTTLVREERRERGR
jgi:hypothetical protein